MKYRIVCRFGDLQFTADVVIEEGVFDDTLTLDEKLRSSVVMEFIKRLEIEKISEEEI